ncbi:echinoidin-like [Amphiura filiformis]|uniref:echinoidin-like n=1 Tax=Amphiura filiformis TaxID=82378 RepID=UPI003B224513
MKLVVLALLFVSVVHFTKAQCDSNGDWTRKGNSCYKYIQERLTWNAAYYKCKKIKISGSDSDAIPHLVAITDQNENEFVYNLWRPSHFNPSNAVWIGAARQGDGIYAHWAWPEDTPTWSYSNWEEPKVGGNCGHMGTESTPGPKWGVTECNYLATYFICEYEKPNEFDEFYYYIGE